MIKDKDKFIEYLQERCKELWDENEKLKFQNFSRNIKSHISEISKKDNSLVPKGDFYQIYSGSHCIGEVNINDKYMTITDNELEIHIDEMKNIIKLIDEVL